MDTNELEKLLKQDEDTKRRTRLAQRDKGLHYPRRLKIKVKKLIENNQQQVLKNITRRRVKIKGKKLIEANPQHALENIKRRSVNHFLPGCAEFSTCNCLKLQALGINSFDELVELFDEKKVIQ
jgi:hypothetical protein